MNLLSNMFFDINQTPLDEGITLVLNNPFFALRLAERKKETSTEIGTMSDVEISISMLFLLIDTYPAQIQHKKVDEILSMKSISDIEIILTELYNKKNTIVSYLSQTKQEFPYQKRKEFMDQIVQIDRLLVLLMGKKSVAHVTLKPKISYQGSSSV